MKFVEIYIDDITILSRTLDEHLKHIKIVLMRLVEAGLKIKPSKCTWFGKEVKLLGHIVSGEEVKMDPSKIVAIQQRQRPKNVKEIQQFLGICNYYRKFVKNYAHIFAHIFITIT